MQNVCMVVLTVVVSSLTGKASARGAVARKRCRAAGSSGEHVARQLFATTEQYRPEPTPQSAPTSTTSCGNTIKQG